MSPRAETAASRVFLGAALLGLAWVGQHRMAESDVFWHLHQGRAVLRHMARVVPEPTAFPELARETPVAAWLWDVIAYLVQSAAGFGGLAWLTSACALLAGAAVIWMLRGVRPAAPPAALVLVGTIALASITSRARARPEIAALLVLPLLVGALRRFTDEQYARARPRYFALATVAALLWAQLHGSFLLVLPIAGVMLGAALLDSWREPRARAALLALGLALLIASLTSTSGLDLLSYGAEHAAADIKRHNQEMHAPVWQTFHPLQSVFGPLYLLMAGLAVYGAVRARRAALAELGLALLGLAVVMQSVRFLAMATVLAAPLALHGASELAGRARGRLVPAVLAASCLFGALLFYRVIARAERTIGPLGRVGLAEHALPLAGIEYLKRTPRGTRVLTAYDAGGSVGFFLDGRVRTFVDSRTMVLFDDVQFALARDVFGSRAALDRAAKRYRAQVVVVPRQGTACGLLSAPWFPVAVEPQWTTFTTLVNAPVLHGIAPCGSDYMMPGACDRGGAALAADVQRQRALRPGPLLDFVAALRLAICTRDFAAAAQRLPARSRAEGFEQPRDLAAGEIALGLRKGDAVLDAVGGWAAQGDPAAWDLLARAVPLGTLPSARLQAVARSAVELLDDRTPPRLRELLALLCIDAGDVSCAHFHGLRAALGGSPHADAILRWLAREHPDPAVRADAEAWRATLTATSEPGE